MTFRAGDRVKYVGGGEGRVFDFFVGHVGTVKATRPTGEMILVEWDAPMPDRAFWDATSNWYAASLELAEFDVDAWRTYEEETGWGLNPSAVAEAYTLVNGDRNEDYGHPLDDFSKSAAMWSFILDTEVTPEQVALCMVAVKVSRLSNDIDKRDSWVDIAGYVECWQRIQNRREGLE